MKIETGSKLVMIGDSITDAERGRPVGEGLFGAIGKGYVMMVDALMNSVYPERRIRVVNMGNSGDTSRSMLARWQTDAIDQKPDWLSIMIGVNDIWRQFDIPLQTEEHVYVEEYEAALEKMVCMAKPTVKGLVLMTPYYIEARRDDAMRAEMDKYGAVVRKLATKYDTLFVDTQAAFDEYLEHYYPTSINWDRVHPNHVGCMIIARAFLKAVDFDF